MLLAKKGAWVRVDDLFGQVAVTDAVQDMFHLRFDDAIVDVDPIPARFDDGRSPHLGQVLRHDGLREAQAVLDLTNGLLFVFQELQNPQTIRVANHLDDVGGLPQSGGIDGTDKLLSSHGE